MVTKPDKALALKGVLEGPYEPEQFHPNSCSPPTAKLSGCRHRSHNSSKPKLAHRGTSAITSIVPSPFSIRSANVKRLEISPFRIPLNPT